MEKNDKTKLEDLLNKINKEFPKISLKDISEVEDYIRNEQIDAKIVKDLSFFLLDYDKKSVENNTKYGFPESDFEDYKFRDLFIVRTYKELVLRLEKDNKDTEKIREFLKLGGQKVFDRKVPYRCLKLGRLDYDDTYDDFKELMRFYQEKIKKYDKTIKFQETDNTKAYIDYKKTKRYNFIKLLIVIVVVTVVFFVGREVGKRTNLIVTPSKPSTNTTSEEK